MSESVNKKMKQLRTELAAHARAYYELDAPMKRSDEALHLHAHKIPPL
jgi:NAD-dependent DNA ligase